MTTQSLFKYRYPPFSDTFEVKESYLSATDEVLIKRAISFISQGKSMCFYGKPGTGKSMLLKAIAAELDTKTYNVAIIPYGSVKRNVLLRDLCDAFGIDASGRGSLLGRLRKHFISESEKPFPVIMVDDAHELEKESFMDLCTLLHDVKKRTCAAALVLCGHACLKTMLGLDIFSPVKTRMAFMLRTSSLTPEESADFIKHRLKIAGADEDIIDEDAMAVMAADTGGNRRDLMNRCAMAMEIATERKEKIITADLVNSLEMES